MGYSGLFLKRTVKSFASATGINVGFPKATPGSVNILAYHRVVADIYTAERNSIKGIVVSAETFRSHLEVLRESFQVVSLESAKDYLSGKLISKKPIAVITFDDGYLDNYEVAFPILKEFGLPATIFLPTDFIGKSVPLAHDRLFWLVMQAFNKLIDLRGAFLDAGMSQIDANRLSCERSLEKLAEALVYLPNELREKIINEIESLLGKRIGNYPKEYQLLDWDMVREMSLSGISFGVHTSSHSDLTAEDHSSFEYEISESKRKLEHELGEDVFCFAYPNGKYNASIRQFVSDCGFSVAVTTEKKINQIGNDLLTLGRISLCEESTRGLVGSYSRRIASLRFGAPAQFQPERLAEMNRATIS